MITSKNQRIAKALLHEVDVTLQRCYRQSLTEVVQDLVVRNILKTSRLSDDKILRTIYETGVLRMSASPKMAEMQSTLKRYATGVLGSCSRCGGAIGTSELERNPGLRFCSVCRPKENSVNVSYDT